MTVDFALGLLLAASAVCYALLGLRLVLAQRQLASLQLGALFLVMAFWVAGGSIELFSDTFYVFSIGRTFHFIGTALIPLVALACFREYTGSTTGIHALILMSIVPTISIIFAATNQFHEFMWTQPAMNAAGEFLTRPDAWGPWFLFVHAPYSYSIIGAAILTLVLRGTMVPAAHRRGLSFLVLACQVPVLATLAYDFGLGSNTLSYVPFALTAMLPFYAWLIIGDRLIEFAPIAYETVFQNMQDPVVVLDEQGRVTGLNHVAEEMLQISEEDALRRPLADIFGSGATMVFEALETGKPQKILTDTGRFLHVRASPIAGRAGSARGGRVLMFRDVSDVEKAQSDVRKSEKLLRTLIDHSVNGVVRLRWVSAPSEGANALRCIFANPAAAEFLDATVEGLYEMGADAIVQLACNAMDERDKSEILKEMKDALDGGRTVDREVTHVADGALRFLRMIFVPTGDDVTITLIDLTDSKEKQQQIETIAWTDPLTGTLNRRGFERDASEYLSNSDDAATGALLFVDLNDFKPVNDRYGHAVGDQLLTIAARRLRKALRNHDIIGRPGGDEFVALVPDVTPQKADRIALRLTEALEQQYVIHGETVYCSASIGMAFYPGNANTLTGLLREADTAMYRAKARSRAQGEVHFSELLERAV